ILMLSSNNILSPATGKPIVTPTHDMISGAYYLTVIKDGEKGEGRVFRHSYEVERALENGDIALHAKIKLRRPKAASNGNGSAAAATADDDAPIYDEVEITPGRLLFSNALPAGFTLKGRPLVNELVRKGVLADII